MNFGELSGDRVARNTPAERLFKARRIRVQHDLKDGKRPPDTYIEHGERAYHGVNAVYYEGRFHRVHESMSGPWIDAGCPLPDRG